jgi:hypothetical protein
MRVCKGTGISAVELNKILGKFVLAGFAAVVVETAYYFFTGRELPPYTGIITFVVLMVYLAREHNKSQR